MARTRLGGAVLGRSFRFFPSKERDMSRSGVEFGRMSTRECWSWLDGYLAEMVRDPRSAQISYSAAVHRAALARDCLLELRERSSQLQLTILGQDYGRAS